MINFSITVPFVLLTSIHRGSEIHLKLRGLYTFSSIPERSGTTVAMAWGRRITDELQHGRDEMNAGKLKKWGIAPSLTKEFLRRIQPLRDEGMSPKEIQALYRAIAEAPADYVDDPRVGDLAERVKNSTSFVPREEPAPFVKWGEDLDPAAIQQLRNGCMLPVAHRGALMPDAHRGYGLPIGGVLATKNAVIPYAVGVDIACRVKLTVLDLPASSIEDKADRLARVLEEETRFGMGAAFDDPHDHPVLDEDWEVSPITKQFRDKARKQLGSSGGGNHFAEFGILTIEEEELGLEPGEYLALLTHSGSRGVGASVAGHYSRLAQDLHPELPKELKHLAWLDLDSEVGQEYWAAMNLMGKYASANHAVMHREILARLGAEALVSVENHHNFAWKEVHDAEEVIVHRKGATPAGEGVLGVIPGSMTEPAFVVRGKGEALSLESAAHGAGRVMSRTQAHREIHWKQVEKKLAESKVTLLSAGIDEAPQVYKDIEEVMAFQEDLVEEIARFQPRIVKMAAD
jgi:tRNA-splicing ligase RtcB (3'-phosphate/5'-hydroxy nucleic acid ligase)